MWRSIDTPASSAQLVVYVSTAAIVLATVRPDAPSAAAMTTIPASSTTTAGSRRSARRR